MSERGLSSQVRDQLRLSAHSSLTGCSACSDHSNSAGVASRVRLEQLCKPILMVESMSGGCLVPLALLANFKWFWSKISVAHTEESESDELRLWREPGRLKAPLTHR